MKTLLLIVAIVAIVAVVVFILLRGLTKKHLAYEQALAKQARKEKEAAEKALEPEAMIEAAEKANKCAIEHPAEKEPCAHNCYFFNIHRYKSSKGKDMFCVVCKASINGHWYSIKVNNSYYPNIDSYTRKVAEMIINKFVPDMPLEEFLKKGSESMDNVGEAIIPLYETVG
jgi:hypothetical protein